MLLEFDADAPLHNCDPQRPHVLTSLSFLVGHITLKRCFYQPAEMMEARKRRKRAGSEGRASDLTSALLSPSVNYLLCKKFSLCTLVDSSRKERFDVC